MSPRPPLGPPVHTGGAGWSCGPAPAWFPASALVDPFDRPDGPLGDPWDTQPPFTGRLAVIAGGRAVPDGGLASGGVWTQWTFGGDAEVWGTAPTVTDDPATGADLFLHAGAAGGYDIYVAADADGGGLWVYDGGWQFLEAMPREIVPGPGDAWGMRTVGDHVEGWHRPADGEWTRIMDAVDVRFRQGWIGFLIDGPGGSWENFGGGCAVEAGEPPEPTRRALTPKGRDMLETLPAHERDDPNFVALMDVGSRELQRIEDFANLVRTQFFPQNATDEYKLLSLWESQLGLPVAPPASIEQRQQSVMANVQKRNTAAAFDWVAALSRALRTTGWSYEENTPSDYKLTITLPYGAGTFTAAQALVMAEKITGAHIQIVPRYTVGFIIGTSLVGIEAI